MRVLFIIAFRDFQDVEFLKTKEILEQNNIECDVASTQKGIAKGSFGAEFKVSKILEEISPQDYDCVIFIGGAGTPSVRAKRDAIRIAEQSYKLGKLTCAICWAPTILAKAGILKNKKATVWVGSDNEYQKSTKEVLEQYGADFVDKELVVDGNLITANGPPSAEKFAKEIIKFLGKK
ncbi:MAG: DJ-1 family protein [Candidatus Diapherotrites archaeon CG08_land_8_20_14_0_20_30_16]|nr:MAG: DJ-1 family protein [Candidatus Diapherotrites archaeon CG08_land_8_20_14_0_20_30_16]